MWKMFFFVTQWRSYELRARGKATSRKSWNNEKTERGISSARVSALFCFECTFLQYLHMHHALHSGEHTCRPPAHFERGQAKLSDSYKAIIIINNFFFHSSQGLFRRSCAYVFPLQFQGITAKFRATKRVWKKCTQWSWKKSPSLDIAAKLLLLPLPSTSGFSFNR